MKQKEIKFRAFNGKVIKQVDQITMGEKTWTCDNGYSVSIPYQPHIVLMQYTGLKDKNNKEIYEGDVLKHRTGLGIVIWADAAFAIKSPGSEAIDFEHSSYYKECEIVGNIYETPEILNN